MASDVRWAMTFTGRQSDGREYATTVESDSLSAALWQVLTYVLRVHLVIRPRWRRPA